MSIPANPFSSFHWQSNPADLHGSKTYHRNPTTGNGTRASQPSFKIYHPRPFLNYSPRVFGIRLSINSSLPSPSPVDDVASFYERIYPQIRPERTQASRPTSRFIGDLSVLHDFQFPSRFKRTSHAPILSRN